METCHAVLQRPYSLVPKVKATPARTQAPVPVDKARRTANPNGLHPTLSRTDANSVRRTPVPKLSIIGPPESGRSGFALDFKASKARADGAGNATFLDSVAQC